VRADVFRIHPLITKILQYLGLSPAFRLDYDGKDALWENRDMFKGSEAKLLRGETLLMYPEGKHQNKHWLGDFSLGYTKLAFETAELGHFEKDISILPCCNHYSAYKDMQHDLVIKFGKPISLKPYYELYQVKPRSVQRQLNELVREQLLGLMLHISDLENYQAIDFIRHTYGRKFAETNGFKADFLPDKMESDQLLVKKLQDAKDENNLALQPIFDDALAVEDALKQLNVRDDQFDKKPGWCSIAVSILALTALFPVWLFALWPNIIIYQLPSFVMRRIKDKQFHNSFLYTISGIATMPILYIFSFILAWIAVNWWVALIYALILPWLGLFAFYYWRLVIRTGQDIRFRRLINTEKGRRVNDLRENLNEQLSKLL